MTGSVGTRRARARRVAGALALLCAATPVHALAQAPAPAIRVLRSSQISTANPKQPHVESMLAIDPRDPAHLIAASMVGRASGKLGTNIYASFDGGRRWTPSRIAPRDSALYIGGDPVVHITRDGTALFALGTRVEGKPATVVSRSADGGRSWARPLALPYRDRPYVAFDTTGQRLDGTIYIAGQFGPLLLSRSTDDARTFDFAQILSRDLGGADETAPIRGVLTDMLVTPDGVLVMPFMGPLDMRDSTQRPPARDSVVVLMLRTLVSDDGGRSFLAVREGPRMHMTGGFRGVQALGGARAAIDQSRGSHRGRIYLVWSDWETARKAYVVRLAFSDDLGKSWKTTIVNDDASGRDPGNPAIAVNRDGIVGVIWNDRRDDPMNRCWRLYGAISTDGGESFLPNVRMSDAPTCVSTPANWVLNAWSQYDYWTTPERPRPGFAVTAYVAVRFPNGGDTQGLVADADGTFHAAWINGETGTLQLWYTAFAPDSQLVSGVRARNAEHTTGPAAEPVPAGKVDATQELAFEVSDPRIDFERGTLEVTVRVMNPTTHALRGPIDVVLDRLTSERDKAMGLQRLQVANADNGEAGVGAAWTFAVASDGLLPPGGTTAPRVLRFSFTGGFPQEPEGYFEPAFRIFARAGGAAAGEQRGGARRR
ncbi:MAG TPA: sialidase family protein [Gemmatimonadaceae bacterium]|nr:sialidase family protein [Gemmatimonadaceae bacterium]